jgi:hypothetical protein
MPLTVIKYWLVMVVVLSCLSPAEAHPRFAADTWSWAAVDSPLTVDERLTPPDTLGTVDERSNPPDSLEVLRELTPPPDSLANGDLPSDSEKEPVEKSPAWAAVRSAILPGWGQCYVDQHFKAVLFAGAQATLVTLTLREHKAANRDMDLFDSTQDSTYYYSSLDHETNKDNFISWAIITSLLSVLDAYIDAHLYGFEENVTFGDEGEMEISVRYEFH